MDDFNFWWYIIAAIVYFFAKKKKKQPSNSRPGSENNPPYHKPKSFEDLLKEITEGNSEKPIVKEEPVRIKEIKKEEPFYKREGEKRLFADDESKRIYENSIKLAADDIERDKKAQESRLFKGYQDIEEEWTIADEIREGLATNNEAKKAIIYSEILSKKY